MAYGEIFETTNQNGNRIRVRDELADNATELAELKAHSQKVRMQIANLAIVMNTYDAWFTPAPQPPSLKPFNPFEADQLPLQTVN